MVSVAKLLMLSLMIQVGSSIKTEHQALSLVKTQDKRKVHKSTDTLFAVPHYSNLLDNQGDKDKSECGCLLVSSKQGWRMEMAKWIGEAQAAELNSDLDDENDIPLVMCNAKWKLVMLMALFGGQELISSWNLSTEMNVEAALMEALAEAEEDEWLDDGAMEIGSDEEYGGWCNYLSYYSGSSDIQKSWKFKY